MYEIERAISRFIRRRRATQPIAADVLARMTDALLPAED